MFRLIGVLTLALLISMPFSADAKKAIKQQVDMAKYTCGDLMSEDEEDMGAVLIWIDGYLSGKTGDMTIDMDFLAELGGAVGEACNANKNAKVLNVVEKLVKQ